MTAVGLVDPLSFIQLESFRLFSFDVTTEPSGAPPIFPAVDTLQSLHARESLQFNQDGGFEEAFST
jgi:hypothetical protein